MAVQQKPKKKVGPADRAFLLDDYLLYNLVRASAVYHDEMADALRSHGLTTVQWRILMLLHDHSPSSVGGLARRSVTKMPTLTRMLMRMEKEGLVKRKVLAGDRRVVEVTMTKKAENTLRKVQSIGQRVFERAVEGVDAKDIFALTNTLKHIRQNLQRSTYEVAEE